MIEPDSGRPAAADRAAVLHLRVGSVLLAVGALAFAIAGLQLVWPGLLGGVAVVSYGRLLPAAVSLLLFGGVVVALVGAAHLVVGRWVGVPLWGGAVPVLALALTAGGVVAGAVAVLLGYTDGRELAELPLWADVAVAAGLLGSAYVATRTAGLAADRAAPPAVWFAIGGLWWSALAYVAMNLPGLAGVNAAIQGAFATGALLLGAVPALVVAVAYHIVGGLPPQDADGEAEAEGDGDAGAAELDDSADADQLARIAFWSLFFAAGWAGARWLVHGPAPDWLETIGAVFSIVYLVPVLAVTVDLVRRSGGAWAVVAGDTGLRFLASAVGALVVTAAVNLTHALRGAAAVVNLTLWSQAFLVLVVFGAAGFAVAGLVHVEGSSGRAGRGQFLLALTGAGLAAGAAWAAGLHQGWTWVADANSPDVTAVGPAFVSSVGPLEAWLVLAAIGGVLLFVAHTLLAAVAFRAEPGAAAVVEPAAVVESAGEAADVARGPDGGAWAELPLRLAVQGAVGLFLVAALAVMIVPAFEKVHREESLRGAARDFPSGSLEDDGRRIYVSEGCMYCHTQQVRAIVTDVGLGPVSQPGDYADAVPALLGSARVGPDLMHAGAREPTSSVRWLLDHLSDPRAERPWSIMPSYDHLSAADLQALAQYVAALR